MTNKINIKKKKGRYLPASANRLFNDFKFVLNAVAIEGSRYALNHLMVEQNRIVATDGRRLHFVELEHDYELGQYEVIKNSGTEIFLMKVDDDEVGRFPKYDEILPPKDNYFEAGDLMTILKGLFKKDICINLQFINDVIFDDELFTIYYTEKDRPIRIEHKDRTAILMPINVKDIDYHEKQIEETEVKEPEQINT